MRKIIAVVILALGFGVSSAYAQERFELTPFGGTRFGGQVDLTTPNMQDVDYLKIKSTWDYGVIGTFTLWPKFQLEAMWNRQPTQFEAHNATTGAFAAPTDATLDMFQFGPLYEFGNEHAKLKPFITGGLGFTNFHSNGVLPFDNRFSANVGGGVKYFFTRHVGMRLEARYSPTETSTSTGLVCDPFVGCFNTRTRNYAQQGQANFGLILRF
ncbi:MAG: outer membrane beta-barrel protein [Candidatus Acidiferrales bacterium]